MRYAEQLVEIEHLTAIADDQENAWRTAMNEQQEEGARVLGALTEILKPAYPILCSTVPIALSAPVELKHRTAPSAVASWKGLRVLGTGPRIREEIEISGNALYLRQDGGFSRLNYRGVEDMNHVEWTAHAINLTHAHVAGTYDVGEILSSITEALTQQISGRKDEHIETLMAIAEKYRAITLLLRK